MSLKNLLGLEGTSLSETEILARIKEARSKNIGEIEFSTTEGSKVIVKLPNADFSKYADPWDGKQGKGNYPQI